MTDYQNVIILGAGASFDAGIPLLSNFIDKMWEYAIRGKVGNTTISKDELELLKEANVIRLKLERYNSRAYFDIRNLEDVLSILSFDKLKEKNNQDYEKIVKAIAITIELSTKIKNEVNRQQQPHIYEEFWDVLLTKLNNGNLPALITFNYDLVLERSLWQFCQKHPLKENVQSVVLDYNSDDYQNVNLSVLHHGSQKVDGQLTNTSFVFTKELPSPRYRIPYLKLHGSLNWETNTSDHNTIKEEDYNGPIF